MTETAAAIAAEHLDGIPLPPKEMWAELSGDPQDPPAAGQAGIAPAAPAPRREIALLEFFGDNPPLKTITLAYPFRWAGQEVREIVARRLTVQQVGDFWDGLPEDGSYDRTDVYGLMCGLPGAVIRALPDTDGFKVTAVCFDFLPPALGGATD